MRRGVAIGKDLRAGKSTRSRRAASQSVQALAAGSCTLFAGFTLQRSHALPCMVPTGYSVAVALQLRERSAPFDCSAPQTETAGSLSGRPPSAGFFASASPGSLMVFPSASKAGAKVHESFNAVPSALFRGP